MGQLVGTLWMLGASTLNISHGDAPALPYNALIGSTPIFYTKSDVKILMKFVFTNLIEAKIFFLLVARMSQPGRIPPNPMQELGVKRVNDQV
jgi:hypothetical protein